MARFLNTFMLLGGVTFSSLLPSLAAAEDDEFFDDDLEDHDEDDHDEDDDDHGHLDGHADAGTATRHAAHTQYHPPGETCTDHNHSTIPSLAIGFHSGAMWGKHPWVHTGLHVGIVVFGKNARLEAAGEFGHHYYPDTEHSHVEERIERAQPEDPEGEELEEEEHGADGHIEWGPIANAQFRLNDFWWLDFSIEAHLLPNIEGSIRTGLLMESRDYTVGFGAKFVGLEVEYNRKRQMMVAGDHYKGVYAMYKTPERDGRHFVGEVGVFQQVWIGPRQVLQGQAVQLTAGFDWH